MGAVVADFGLVPYPAHKVKRMQVIVFIYFCWHPADCPRFYPPFFELVRVLRIVRVIHTDHRPFIIKILF